MNNIIISIGEPVLRERIVRMIHAETSHYVVTEFPHQCLEIMDVDDFLILETKDDIALLSRIVYELYRKIGAGAILGIIAIASMAQVERNPTLQWWLIDGHAAITALQCLPNDNLEAHILWLLARCIPEIIKRPP